MTTKAIVADVRVYPPAAARKLAAEALKVRASLPVSRRGGLTTQQAGKLGIGSGVARARDIVAGKSLDAKQIVRFFDRFRGRIASEKSAGKTMAESKTLQADGLWGGEAMERAARKAVDSATP